MLTLDHLVITAPDLATGTAWAETALGVPFGPGGQHLDMGTHNRLLGLGDIYLEVIAIEPGGTDPGLKRWFDLDACTAPGFTHWACRTDDLNADVAQDSAIGLPKSLARDHLRWSFAIPETGRLPFDDLHPALLQWHTDPPVLPDSGCRLKCLTIEHPQADTLQHSLALSDPRVRITTGAPSISALFDTPNGPRTL